MSFFYCLFFSYVPIFCLSFRTVLQLSCSIQWQADTEQNAAHSQQHVILETLQNGAAFVFVPLLHHIIIKPPLLVESSANFHSLRSNNPIDIRNYFSHLIQLKMAILDPIFHSPYMSSTTTINASIYLCLSSKTFFFLCY